MPLQMYIVCISTVIQIHTMYIYKCMGSFSMYKLYAILFVVLLVFMIGVLLVYLVVCQSLLIFIFVSMNILGRTYSLYQRDTVYLLYYLSTGECNYYTLSILTQGFLVFIVYVHTLAVSVYTVQCSFLRAENFTFLLVHEIFLLDSI